MKKYLSKTLIITVIIILQSCKVQLPDLNVLNIKVQDLGKTCLNNSEKSDLSKVSNIKSKYFTSAIYTTVDEKKICLPVNDKTFDYKYYEQNKERVLKYEIQMFYKSYMIRDKEVKIVYKSFINHDKYTSFLQH